MADYYSGSGSDQYTTAPVAQPQEQSRPVIHGTSLFAALQSVGLVGAPSPATSGRPVYQQPRLAFSPTDLLGSDETGQPTPDIEDDLVYFGDGEANTHVPQPHIGIPGESEEGVGPAAVHPPKTLTVGAAVNQAYLWDDDKVADVMEKMRKAGLQVNSFDEMLSAWSNLVQRASRTFTLSKGKREVTPWDILATTKKENVAAGLLDKDGNIVQTQTQTSVNDISDGDAWSMLRNQMQNFLGRDPSDNEVRDFASKLNALAAKNPSTTTTTTTMDAETGDSSTDSSTTGGFTQNDAEQQIYDDLHDTDEYAQVQSATTYFNALNAALGEVAA